MSFFFTVLAIAGCAPSDYNLGEITPPDDFDMGDAEDASPDVDSDDIPNPDTGVDTGVITHPTTEIGVDEFIDACRGIDSTAAPIDLATGDYAGDVAGFITGNRAAIENDFVSLLPDGMTLEEARQGGADLTGFVYLSQPTGSQVRFARLKITVGDNAAAIRNWRDQSGYQSDFPLPHWDCYGYTQVHDAPDPDKWQIADSGMFPALSTAPWDYNEVFYILENDGAHEQARFNDGFVEDSAENYRLETGEPYSYVTTADKSLSAGAKVFDMARDITGTGENESAVRSAIVYWEKN